MNIWFTGTGPFAALCLEGLTRRGVTFTRIITGLPTRSGRGNKTNPSAVELKASELGLTVTRTGRLSENLELTHELEAHTPDAIFVIDFGQIIREPFLTRPRYGCLNIHPSLLPKLRGAAPIQRALMGGETRTGVTLFRLVPAMDAGGILAQREIAIAPDDNASDLYVRLSGLGCDIAAESLSRLQILSLAQDGQSSPPGGAGSSVALSGLLTLTPQDDSQATFAPKIEKPEHQVTFTMSAQRFVNTVRALDMSGGAYVLVRDRRVKLWRASLREDVRASSPGQVLSLEGGLVISCSDYGVELRELQSEGKNIVSSLEWSRGLRLKAGDVL